MSLIALSDRLTLRPLRGCDGDAMVEYLGDLDVSRWLSRVPHPFTHSDLKISNEDGTSRWPDLMGIALEDRLIGCVGTADHLGYWLGAPFWGRGIASSAVRAAVDNFFGNTNQDRLQSGYFIDNAASAKILTGLGFREVGREMHPCAALNTELMQAKMVITRQEWGRVMPESW